jgi:hypothetical protein
MQKIDGEGDFSLLKGGSEVAEFFALTAEQMREPMIASGAIDGEKLDRALGSGPIKGLA